MRDCAGDEPYKTVNKILTDKNVVSKKIVELRTWPNNLNRPHHTVVFVLVCISQKKEIDLFELK